MSFTCSSERSFDIKFQWSTIDECMGICKLTTEYIVHMSTWEFLNLVVLSLVVCQFFSQKRSFALLCTILRPFALFCGLAFALFSRVSCSFALFCAHLHVSASENDRVWELQINIHMIMMGIASVHLNRLARKGLHRWEVFGAAKQTSLSMLD